MCPNFFFLNVLSCFDGTIVRLPTSIESSGLSMGDEAHIPSCHDVRRGGKEIRTSPRGLRVDSHSVTLLSQCPLLFGRFLTTHFETLLVGRALGGVWLSSSSLLLTPQSLCRCAHNLNKESIYCTRL